ncbi:S8 family serine peptidase [Streptomyces sp. H10-C2]|uniref:S8 family peptidase n=1 Tax=unclassified Streptomyces TaxID=2593676 RepID=UPI0024BBC347|nr:MULTISPECIES: S8 family serine peptidase [unclassified Streptomyces]MDJ0344850.1 S8 family serine peptidase [Streptomyces sp. PH10-H1]MDJ0371910.1 S8 family serine peptidase [Streptomyces sp. H10-C2]
MVPLHRRSGRRRVLAATVGMAMAAAITVLPGAASAVAADGTAAAEGPLLSYVVNTKVDHGTIKSVERAIGKAGGQVVISYEKIGVIVVHSANPGFAAAIREAHGVETAGATRTSAIAPASTTELGAPEKLTAAQVAAATAKAGAGQEPLEPNQWDLRAIKADQAAMVNPGSSKVTVGVIDTGIDDTHPDLAANFSASQSANCVGGVADTTPGAWRPYNPATDYHGTHVAGEIAAARNGIGVAGVAPGVKVAAIKVSEPVTSLFYPESVVCAFVFAADHGISVTNNSYYIDPWLYNCLDDPDQRAIVDAVNRASKYSERKGVLNVASAGNSNNDLDSHALTDASSPDDSTAVTRTVDPHQCFDIPTQLPGVVTVSATGVQNLKSYYSSYGRGVIDVAAPGGDKYQIPDTPGKNGRILSTLPGNTYGYLQGTSMASPHVAGVAALIKSKHPNATPEQIQWILKAEADNPGCPTGLYDPDGNGVQDATCTGPQRVNSFYGFGIVDALDAVTK